MVTIYLCGVSVLIAYAIGVPLGIWAAERRRAGMVVRGFMDTLQTLPSFVYLIPVVMLFRVGDSRAMIAVVLYALAPAVRYAAHGVRSVDPTDDRGGPHGRGLHATPASVAHQAAAGRAVSCYWA